MHCCPVQSLSLRARVCAPRAPMYAREREKNLAFYSLINHQPVIRFVCIAFKCNFNVIFFNDVIVRSLFSRSHSTFQSFYMFLFNISLCYVYLVCLCIKCAFSMPFSVVGMIHNRFTGFSHMFFCCCPHSSPLYLHSCTSTKYVNIEKAFIFRFRGTNA